MEMTGERGCANCPGLGAFLPIWGFALPPGRRERVERNGTPRGRGAKEERDETPGETDGAIWLFPSVQFGSSLPFGFSVFFFFLFFHRFRFPLIDYIIPIWSVGSGGKSDGQD
ncbi:hypothetical protein AAC387_Pa07g1815 [Persea americana]